MVKAYETCQESSFALCLESGSQSKLLNSMGLRPVITALSKRSFLPEKGTIPASHSCEDLAGLTGPKPPAQGLGTC